MLVLSRCRHEQIVLPDHGVTITILDTSSNRVRIGIHAPPNVGIRRAELPESLGAKKVRELCAHC